MFAAKVFSFLRPHASSLSVVCDQLSVHRSNLPRLFSTIQFAAESEPFYEERPNVKGLCQKIEERREEALKLYKGDDKKELFFTKSFAPVTCLNLPMLMRMASPDSLWPYFRSNKEGGLNTKSVLDDKTVQDLTLSNTDGLHKLDEIFEKKGGPGLASVSQSDLAVYWKHAKDIKDYDAMVQLFHCCRASHFTANGSRILDFAFAHLNSAYVQPRLSLELARKLLQEQDTPQIRFVMGTSLNIIAKIAQHMTRMQQAQKMNPQWIDRYRECFPNASFDDSQDLTARSFHDAALALEKAFNAQPNTVHGATRIINFLEQGNIESAKSLSSSISGQLHTFHELSPYQAKAFVMVGVLSRMRAGYIQEALEKLNRKDSDEEQILKLIEEVKEIFVDNALQGEIEYMQNIIPDQK